MEDGEDRSGGWVEVGDGEKWRMGRNGRWIEVEVYDHNKRPKSTMP